MADIASSASTVINRFAFGNLRGITAEYAMTTGANSNDTVQVPGLSTVLQMVDAWFVSSAATTAFSLNWRRSSAAGANFEINTPTTHNNFSVRYTVFGR